MACFKLRSSVVKIDVTTMTTVGRWTGENEGQIIKNDRQVDTPEDESGGSLADIFTKLERLAAERGHD